MSHRWFGGMGNALLEANEKRPDVTSYERDMFKTVMLRYPVLYIWSFPYFKSGRLSSQTLKRLRTPIKQENAACVHTLPLYR